MRIVIGDIWAEWEKSSGSIVIPTNVGYRKNGSNVMGLGLAKDAARRWPELPAWYGRFCMLYGAGAFPIRYDEVRSVILLPVKPFDAVTPHLSWKAKADLKLIESSVEALAKFYGTEPIYVPMVGCGNGKLKDLDVLPILERHLTDERFVLVKR
ncbi:MAG: hypothetical protein ACREH5_08015 [Candidatus Omnitrophota bacterium]